MIRLSSELELGTCIYVFCNWNSSSGFLSLIKSTMNVYGLRLLKSAIIAKDTRQLDCHEIYLGFDYRDNQSLPTSVSARAPKAFIETDIFAKNISEYKFGLWTDDTIPCMKIEDYVIPECEICKMQYSHIFTDQKSFICEYCKSLKELECLT
jgi:hypothetical protein